MERRQTKWRGAEAKISKVHIDKTSSNWWAKSKHVKKQGYRRRRRGIG